MSLPSISSVMEERGVVFEGASRDQLEGVLVEAMRRDIPLAVDYLQSKAREVLETGSSVNWLEDPESVLGKQLIRLHASDAMRPLAQKHFCFNHRLVFVNCCGGKILPNEEETLEEEVIRLQIASQNGVIAYADC